MYALHSFLKRLTLYFREYLFQVHLAPQTCVNVTHKLTVGDDTSLCTDVFETLVLSFEVALWNVTPGDT